MNLNSQLSLQHLQLVMANNGRIFIATHLKNRKEIQENYYFSRSLSTDSEERLVSKESIGTGGKKWTTTRFEFDSGSEKKKESSIFLLIGYDQAAPQSPFGIQTYNQSNANYYTES